MLDALLYIILCNSVLYTGNAKCENNECRADNRGAGMTLLVHSSVLHSEECLHIAVARHRVIYLFDYCPATWHVLVIDGHCVPVAAGPLVSPARAWRTALRGPSLVPFTFSTCLHFITPFPSPFTSFYQFLPLLQFFFPPSLFQASSLLVVLQMQIGRVTFESLLSITVAYWSVFMCTLHEGSCSRERSSHPPSCLGQSLAGWPRLYCILPDLAHTLASLL